MTTPAPPSPSGTPPEPNGGVRESVPESVPAIVLSILGALGIWALEIVAGFGGFALAVAGVAIDEAQMWWRAPAVGLGAAAALVALVISCRSAPRRPVTWLGAAALVVVVGFATLQLAR